MKRYLLDTGIMGNFINKRHGVDIRARDERRKGARIGTCMPVVGELFGGIELSDSRKRNLKTLNAALTKLVFWPFNLAAAKEFGRLYAELRREGPHMQQVDLQLAAISLTLGRCTVVSTDSDLKAIPGLKVENWAA
jgi:tRNA(fMet)-specific endonuclease VapC